MTYQSFSAMSVWRKTIDPALPPCEGRARKRDRAEYRREKPGIQAIERKYPGRGAGAGTATATSSVSLKYIRSWHPGADLPRSDVHTGQVLGSCRERPATQDDLVAFMERAVAHAYPGKQVHVIWDNLNTHSAHIRRVAGIHAEAW